MASLYDIRQKALEAQSGQVQMIDHRLGAAAVGAPQEKDSSRDSRAIFRAAYNFYDKFHPPRLDAAYWGEAVKEINNLSIDFDNDSLLIGLLHAIYADLESACIASGASGEPLQGAIDA